MKLPERDRITTLEYKQDWQLDQTGNWSQFKQYDQSSQSNALDQQRTQNTANEITAFDSTVGDIWKTPQHDRNGNMTTMPKPAALTAGYDAIYDAWNRLAEVKETGGAAVADYQYDGLNRRTTKLVSGTTTHFYYSDNWQVLEERLNALTTANQQYVWGIRYIDDLVLRDHTTLGRHYALQDANWNIVAITNDTGAVEQRFEYDAYGKPLALNPNFTTPYNGTNHQWEYLFTGRRLDLETDLYQYRNRYYHAELGRFVSRDPIGYAGGINLYAYVNGNPLTATDPSGLFILINARKSTIYVEEFLRGYRSKKINDKYTPQIFKIPFKEYQNTDIKGGKPCPKCALIWVHGVNNDIESAIEAFSNVEKSYKNAGGKSTVYGFAWNSDPVGLVGKTSFGAQIQAANQVATGAFSHFIRDLKAACPKTIISLGGHSLGTRVILGALQNGVGVTGIKNTVLVAAAVDNEALQIGEEFSNAPKYTKALQIGFNAKDAVLNAAFTAKNLERGLGSTGSKNKKLVPKNVTEKDFTKDFGIDHSGVYKEKKNSNFWNWAVDNKI